MPELDEDGKNWNDLLSSYFDKIKSNQEKLSLLIKQHRREQMKQAKELEIERENRNKQLEVQNTQQQHELSLLLNKVKTLESSEENEQKTVKLPPLSAPTFNGEPTKWKSYWQQFEATIHNSKKLHNQLPMQYLLKFLVTKRARDAIEGIDAAAEAYPEAIAALMARFDRPQIIHRAHARALLNAKPVKDGTSSELRQLHDTFHHHLRSLKAQDKLDFDRFMTVLSESKLDSQTMIEWQKLAQAEKDVPSYTKFLEFLDLRATTTELTPYECNQRKSQPFNKKPKSYSPGNFNKSELIHATTAQVKCLAFNGQKHSIAYCQTFKEKYLSEKRAFVYQKVFASTA